MFCTDFVIRSSNNLNGVPSLRTSDMLLFVQLHFLTGTVTINVEEDVKIISKWTISNSNLTPLSVKANEYTVMFSAYLSKADKFRTS